MIEYGISKKLAALITGSKDPVPFIEEVKEVGDDSGDFSHSRKHKVINLSHGKYAGGSCDGRSSEQGLRTSLHRVEDRRKGRGFDAVSLCMVPS